MTRRFGWGGDIQGGDALHEPAPIVYTYSTNKNQRDGFVYDAAGNLKDGESNQHYLYNAIGQQTNAWQVNGYNMSQGYDGAGLRGVKSENETPTYYLRSSVLGGAVVAELDASGGFSRGYFYRGDQLLAVQQSGHMYWVHEDAITKSQRTTDVYGAVTTNGVVELYPWGANTTRSSPTVFQPHQISGYTKDGNGDQDAMARRYSPTGRFSQPDPYSGSYDFSDPQSLNRYAYVGNDPVNRKDPSGMMSTIDCGPGTIAVQGADGTWQCVPGGTVTVTMPRYVPATTWRTSLVSSISMRGYLSGTRDHGGDPDGLNAGRGGQHVTAPAPSNNPDCNKFVDQLLDYFYSSYTSTGAGIGMIKLAKDNINFNGVGFTKNMPGEPAGPLNGATPNLNGFRPELVDNGQRGDVYHHIQWMAGSVLAPGGAIPAGLLGGSDALQKRSGRAESITELRDDKAGISVGGVLDSSWLRSQASVRQEITKTLCK